MIAILLLILILNLMKYQQKKVKKNLCLSLKNKILWVWDRSVMFHHIPIMMIWERKLLQKNLKQRIRNKWKELFHLQLSDNRIIKEKTKNSLMIKYLNDQNKGENKINISLINEEGLKLIIMNIYKYTKEFLL